MVSDEFIDLEIAYTTKDFDRFPPGHDVQRLDIDSFQNFSSAWTLMKGATRSSSSHWQRHAPETGPAASIPAFRLPIVPAQSSRRNQRGLPLESDIFDLFAFQRSFLHPLNAQA